MSLLTDDYIKSNLCVDEVWDEKDKNKIHIHPFSEGSLTPVGYDLRVGSRYGSRRKGKIIDGISGKEKVVINPGDTVLIETYENIGMPKDKSTSGLVLSMVSAVSKGLSHIATTVDADWKGRMLIGVHNPSWKKIELEHASPFCTLVFFENKSASVKLSDYQPDRVDNLLKGFVSKRPKVVKYASYIIPVLVILISVLIGYIFFGDSNAFVGIVAGGVGISYILMLLITSLY